MRNLLLGFVLGLVVATAGFAGFCLGKRVHGLAIHHDISTSIGGDAQSERRRA